MEMTHGHNANHRLNIGCAGWSLRGDLQGVFPADGSHLQRFASVFAAVEVNSCFYQSHRKSTWLRWAECTPESFRFSYKLSKSITHQARLQGVVRTLPIPLGTLPLAGGSDVSAAGEGLPLGPLPTQSAPQALREILADAFRRIELYLA